MSSILVSVVIPSFNHIEYVQSSIESVLNSNYENIEIIVIDDCSTDGSQKMLEKLKLTHEFKLILNEKNLGLNKSLQKTMSLCTGEFISFLASDDFILKDKISRQVEFLVNENKDGVYSNSIIVDSESHQLGVPDLSLFRSYYSEGKTLDLVYIDDSSAPLLQSGLFKTKVMQDLFWVRERYQSDDWALQIKLFELYNIGYMDVSLFCYRKHMRNTYTNYWKTLPYRIDLICNLVPEDLRMKALQNILLSLSTNAFYGKKKFVAIRFFAASLPLSLPWIKIKKISKKIISFFVFYNKKN